MNHHTATVGLPSISPFFLYPAITTRSIIKEKKQKPEIIRILIIVMETDFFNKLQS